MHFALVCENIAYETVNEIFRNDLYCRSFK